MEKLFLSPENRYKINESLSEKGVLGIEYGGLIYDEMLSLSSKFDDKRARPERSIFYVEQFNRKVIDNVLSKINSSTLDNDQHEAFEDQFSIDTSIENLISIAEKQDADGTTIDQRFKMMSSDREKDILPSAPSSKPSASLPTPPSKLPHEDILESRKGDVISIIDSFKNCRDAHRAKKEYLDAFIFNKIVVDTRLLDNPKINHYSVSSSDDKGTALYFINVTIPCSNVSPPATPYVDFYINNVLVHKLNTRHFVPFKVDFIKETALRDVVFSFYVDNEPTIPYTFEKHHIIEFMVL